jgi:oligopeptide transport system substrate-binding protein
VIANVFLGLYRVADGGVTVPGMAQDCTVSDDGLIREFTLREDIQWYGRGSFTAGCTADDVVFAFQRLMSPELESARAKEYYFIKNAEAINTGKIKDLSQLGVEATDKYKLKITLNERRSDLQAMLAAPPAMPCNREYYELTEGQYGLVGDLTGSNGAFYVSRWHYDKWTKNGNFIELKRNPLNAGALGTAPSMVTCNINADACGWFEAGDVQVCRTSDAEKIMRYTGRYGYNTYSTAVWGVIFNTHGVFESSDLRKALAGCVRADFSGDIYTAADRVIPDGIKLGGGGDYRTLAGVPEAEACTESELTARRENALREVQSGRLSGVHILMPEGTSLRQSVGSFIQAWQHEFGIYCMISELPYSEYIAALSSGDFEIALVRLSGGAGGAVSYPAVFSSSSVLNYAGVSSRRLDDLISGVLTAPDDKTAAGYCLEAERLIMDSGWFAPLCFGKEYVFRAQGVENVGYDPFSGTYLFGNAVKK